MFRSYIHYFYFYWNFSDIFKDSSLLFESLNTAEVATSPFLIYLFVFSDNNLSRNNRATWILLFVLLMLRTMIETFFSKIWSRVLMARNIIFSLPRFWNCWQIDAMMLLELLPNGCFCGYILPELLRKAAKKCISKYVWKNLFRDLLFNCLF